jgi:Flp pilus assembly protein TadG
VPIARRGERGQTLPVWTLGLATMFALMFFIVNYGNMVRWHVRAQNAADSAASAGIATDANMNNEVNMLVYAATVDEVRIRYLLQAMSNLAYDPAACSGQAACDTALAKLSAAYTVAVANYTAVTVQMHTIDSISGGGLANSPATAAGLVATHCTVLDCLFTYTTSIDSAHEIVDVVACKNVATLFPKILGLGTANTFKAVGHSAATLALIPETFAPGSNNPSTGLPYQPNESPVGVNTSADLAVNYSTLSMGLTWFSAGPTRPKTLIGTVACS